MIPNRSKNREHTRPEDEENILGSSSITSHIYKYSDDFKNRWKIDKGIIIESNFEKCLQNADKNAKKKIEKLQTYVKNEKISLEEENPEYYLLTFSAEFRPRERISTGVVPPFVPVNFKIRVVRKNSIVISVGANRRQSKVGIALLSCATTGNPFSIENIQLGKENILKLKDWVLSTIRGQIKGITIYDVEYEGQKFEQISLRSNQLEDSTLSGNLLNSALIVKNLSFTVPSLKDIAYPLNCRITPTGELRISGIAISDPELLALVEKIIEVTVILPKPKEETKKKAQKSYKKGPLRNKSIKRKIKTKRKQPSSEKKEEKIDLGKKKPNSLKVKPQPSLEEREKKSEEKEVTTRIESPFIELDLDKPSVFLVLPQQRFKLDDTVNNVLRQLNYKLELNGEKETTTAPSTNYHSAIFCNSSFVLIPSETTIPTKSTCKQTNFLTERFV
jgi:hypothetical protein